MAPALRGAARLAARGRRSAPAQWRRGLIVGHTHIGDVLYRTCSLGQLHALLPECRWSYLSDARSAEVLEGNPAVAEVLPFVTGDDSWRLAPGAFGELRRREFDVVLCTNATRHHPDFLLAAALGIPNRAGFVGKGLSGLLTHPVPLEYPSPYPAYFRSLVAQVGSTQGDWPLRPRVFLTATEHDEAARTWEEIGVRGSLPVVACALTTRQRSGHWPRAHLIEALRLARREAAFELVLCGAASDAAALAAAAERLDFPVRILAGALRLRPMTAFLSRCAALLTLDSGPRHLGNAAGIPVLFVRNLGDSMIQTGRYCDTEIDLAPPAEHLSDPEIAAAIGRMSPAATARALLDTIARSPRTSA